MNKKQFAAFLLALFSLFTKNAQAVEYKLFDQQLSLNINASSRTRYEFENWLGDNTKKTNYSIPSEKFKLGTELKYQKFSLGVEGQYYGIWNLKQNETGPASSFYNTNSKESSPSSINLRKAYLKYEEIGDYFAILGRQAYSSGTEGTIDNNKDLNWVRTWRVAQRLIGASEFTAGRSFVGGRAEKKLTNNSYLDFSFFNPTSGGSATNTGRTLSDIDIATASWTKNFNLGDKTQSQLQTFYYYYKDSRGLNKTDNNVDLTNLTNIDINTFGFHYLGQVELEEARLDYLVWLALQNGKWGDQEHFADAEIFELGYKFINLAYKPWLRVGFNSSSGDTKANNKKHATFSQLITTPRNFALTPFYNMQNLNDSFIQAIFEASESLQLVTSLHNLNLRSSSDFLYSGGGASNNSSFGYSGINSNGYKSVGNVLDIGSSYLLSENIKIDTYISHVFSSSVLDSNYANGQSDINYGFIDFNLAF